MSTPTPSKDQELSPSMNTVDLDALCAKLAEIRVQAVKRDTEKGRLIWLDFVSGLDRDWCIDNLKTYANERETSATMGRLPTNNPKDIACVELYIKSAKLPVSIITNGMVRLHWV